MSDEVPDIVGMAGLGIDSELLRQIFEAKKQDPNNFPSYWEMDEEDIEEESMEEIQKDPSKKILWAAENNHIDIVKELLELDNELVKSKDNDGYTALHRASYNGHTDMVKFLLQHGASINARTNDGWQALHSASRWNQDSIVSVLLQHGADVNAQTNSGQTALHIASSDRDCKQCLQLLLNDDKVDVDLKNNLGETAYDICQRTSENCLLFEQKKQNEENLNTIQEDS
ncbi:spermatogenesis [Mactra antiquata]